MPAQGYWFLRHILSQFCEQKPSLMDFYEVWECIDLTEANELHLNHVNEHEGAEFKTKLEQEKSTYEFYYHEKSRYSKTSSRLVALTVREKLQEWATLYTVLSIPKWFDGSTREVFIMPWAALHGARALTF